jgi:hypothetical protein
LHVRPTFGLRIALGAFGLAFVLAAGCGTERPPVTNGTGSPSGAAGGGGELFDSPGTKNTKPPGCGDLADGSQCDCLDVPLFVDPPIIYFVLDRSGSMHTPDKWTQVRVTVGKIMRSLGPRANFGAAMFPALGEDACAPGKQVMPVRNGDPPSSSVDGPTTSTLLAVTRVAPGGGTPTGATLENVLGDLGRIAGRKFVILATDGAPNCNANASCSFDQCQLNIENIPGCPRYGPLNCCEPPEGFRENCNDGPRTLAAIGALRSAGIPTYVVGLPGANPYAALLDQMAEAGGTARNGSPKYYAIDTATESVMLAALKKIAAQIAGTCVFELKEPPADPRLVNVYLDDVILPFEPNDGWAIDGKTVTLVGSACERVKNGDVLDVRIIAGCPRVEPK